ncbi:hypothetical protein ACFC6F_10210 [Enterococcus gallinarum]|uniref:hypothetical protein n=1 Tax=Enterococcus gallinarum TaxID=1353 RepID=UPI0035D8D72D
MNYDNFRFYFFLALGLGLGLATTKVTGLMFGLLAVVCSLSLFISAVEEILGFEIIVNEVRDYAENF